MNLLRRARELESTGRDIVHMEIGEPDFTTAEPVIEAGIRALREGHMGYLPAAGLPALREAIDGHYRRCYGRGPGAERIFVTPGASGALMVALALVAEPESGVLLPDPGYPCNRNFVEALDAVPAAVPVGPEDDYQLTASSLERAAPDVVAAMVGSPSNPTGTVMGARALAALGDVAAARGIALIVDEIYHGLHYDDTIASAVNEAPAAFIVNSFSKYFGMTGWRLGWLVVPPGVEAAAEKVIQNLFISASTPAQHAALACFSDAATAIFERRREDFRARRDALLPALRELGFRIPGAPAGAFYLYADSSALADDSFELARHLLEDAGVAVTPGLDFEVTAPQQRVRFAYTTGIDRLEEAVSRMRAWLRAGAGP